MVGLALMFVKYMVFIDAKCEPLNATNGSNSTPHDSSFYINGKKMESGSYMHVMLIVFSTSLSLLNMLEYTTFAWGVYKWLKTSLSSSWLPSYKATRCKCVVCVVCVVSVVFGFLVLASGMLFFAIKMELEKERCEHENSFGRAIGYVYLTHSALDCMNVLVHCGIRVWMIIHTYKIKAIWSREEDSFVQVINTNEIITNNTIEELVDNAFFEEYEIGYKKRGHLAKKEMLPFIPWFMIPLWHFLVLALINPHLLLTPWTYNHSGQRSRVIAKAQYFYFAIVLIKFVQLLVQYACVWRMNEYNQKYFDDMEERVLYKYGRYKEDDNDTVKLFKKCYIVAASQKKMKLKDDFDFEPSFLSFLPKIHVENPLYVVGLVIGLLVSSSDFLYK